MEDFDFKGVAIGLLGALMSIITWLGRQGWKRLERLEQESVRRHDMLKMHEDNRGELREVRKMLEEQNENSAHWRRRLSVAIARLEAHAEKDNGDPSSSGRFHRGNDE